MEKTNKNLDLLKDIRPEKVNLITSDGKIETIFAKNIDTGSQILIKAGETIPIDCIILEGTSIVNTSVLTGESAAREVEMGDELLSGMVNQTGTLKCQTTNSFDKSAASKIIDLVKESALNKGKTEKFITKFSKVYTPVVVMLAAMVFLIPPLLGFGSFHTWLNRSLVFLVSSCPCALVISVPLAFFTGIGRASKAGILMKGSATIEALSKLKCIIFDKTGTLTKGKLAVSKIKSTGSLSEEDILIYAVTAERYSNHPIAVSISEYGKNTVSLDASETKEFTGRGMSYTYNGDNVLCGSLRFMNANHIDVNGIEANVYIAVNKKLEGHIRLEDSVRAEAKDVIIRLKTLGIAKTVMLTGDSKQPALAAKKLTGIDDVHYELLPEQKVHFLEQYKKEVGTTAFVGDGINDAPALAASDVGMAMGMGSGIALDTADVILLSNHLTGIEKAIKLSKITKMTATLNIIIALTIKISVLILAFFGYANMFAGVFADVGVTVIAIFNTIVLLKNK